VCSVIAGLLLEFEHRTCGAWGEANTLAVLVCKRRAKRTRGAQHNGAGGAREHKLPALLCDTYTAQAAATGSKTADG
jgi:hypothetical protein